MDSSQINEKKHEATGKKRVGASGQSMKKASEPKGICTGLCTVDFYS